MREQKFRIWDEQQKCFQYLDLNAPADPHEFYTAMQCKADWLQYTSLKDADGVEIYEGDICTWYVNDIECTGEVFYSGQGFDMRGKDSSYIGGEMLICWDAGRGEIKKIGNIHDNPELLEAV